MEFFVGFFLWPSLMVAGAWFSEEKDAYSRAGCPVPLY